MTAIGITLNSVGRPTVTLGSVLDLTDYLDTCVLCDGHGLIPVPGGLEFCHVCRGCGLARLCPDCEGVGHHRTTDTRPCDGCDGSGQVA